MNPDPAPGKNSGLIGILYDRYPDPAPARS